MSRWLGSIFFANLAPYSRPMTSWSLQASQLIATFTVLFFQRAESKSNVYSILWALVFGFATLNILNLGTKHFEPGKGRLSPGEVLAVMVVFVSIFLLGWEMLYLFKILPLKLR